MPSTARGDPYRNFNFIVEIEGIAQAGFTEVSGLASTVEVIEYREGEMRNVRKLPGMTKCSNITLKSGLTDSHELYNWFRQVTRGIVERKSGSIIVQDLDHTEKMRWNFFEAWPAKWTGPTFAAKGTDVAIETLELAVELIEIG